MSDDSAIRVSAHILQRLESIAATMTDRHFARFPELDRRYGQAGRDHCRADSIFHLRFLAQAIRFQAPALFVDYIAWAKIMLASRGVPAGDLLEHLDTMRGAAAEGLDEEGSNVLGAPIDRAVAAFPSLPDNLDLMMDGPGRESPAGEYLEALLEGDRRTALQLVLASIEGGTTLPDIYLDIFERSQQEIGRMWQMNRISVGQEHYSTAATQMVMSQLFPQLLSANPGKYRIVAACVGDELHEVGLRIVTDLLELSGWSTRYLGANVPAASIIDAAVRWKADAIALSTTLTPHIAETEKIIAAIRKHPETRSIRILVGGAPFQVEKELWRRIGADGWAHDAREAVRVAESLMA